MAKSSRRGKGRKKPRAPRKPEKREESLSASPTAPNAGTQAKDPTGARKAEDGNREAASRSRESASAQTGDADRQSSTPQAADAKAPGPGVWRRLREGLAVRFGGQASGAAHSAGPASPLPQPPAPSPAAENTGASDTLETAEGASPLPSAPWDNGAQPAQAKGQIAPIEPRSRCFTLEVEVLEDLHSGSGHGRGGVIDTALQRDRQGCPKINASHLRGRLRDAGEGLIEDFRGRSEYGFLYRQWLRLFGQAGAPDKRGALQLTSLYLVPPLRKPVVWQSTSREPGYRHAMPDTLRAVEMVPAGSRFRAGLLIRDPDLEDMLGACVQRLDALGGGINLGNGEVACTLLPASDPPPQPTETAAAGDTPCLRLFLRNLEPLRLTVRGYPDNILQTRPHPSGRQLREALFDWICANTSDATVVDRAEALLDRISFGNPLPLPLTPAEVEQASPEAIRGWDLMPFPLNLWMPRETGDSGSDLPWWAQPDDRRFLGDWGEEDRFTSERQDLKRPKGDLFLFREHEGQRWRRYSPKRLFVMRNSTPRDRRRDKTLLFSEQVIAEDTAFLARLRFASTGTATAFAQAFQHLLAGAGWLGIGGGARPVSVIRYDWAPPAVAQANAPQGALTLTLESDLLWRSRTPSDNAGEPRLPGLHGCDTIDREVLCELTGVAAKPDWKLSNRYCEAATWSGFNPGTHLPMADERIIRQGSALRIEGDVSELREKLKGLPALGDRRDEGLGRFRIDFDPLSAPGASASSPPAVPQAEENRADTLLRDSRKLAQELLAKEGKLPSDSQWQALRQGVRQASSLQELTDLMQWLEEHQHTKGGSAWQGVVADLRSGLAAYADYTDQAGFLDGLIRWVRVLKPNEEGRS
jgi:hypothetical protein